MAVVVAQYHVVPEHTCAADHVSCPTLETVVGYAHVALHVLAVRHQDIVPGSLWHGETDDGALGDVALEALHL